jgi:serine/threonine-protein phosphatase 5
MQGQKVIHKKFAIMILLRCREIFEKYASLVQITVPDDKEITVCGDIHG